ncbi:MAG: hypothetical protein Q7R64_04690, partial [bacterium]|nr:hypothetical protein [bacterium]
PTPFRGRDPDFTSGPFQLHITMETFHFHGISILSESGVAVRTSRLATDGCYPLPFSPICIGAVFGLSSPAL